MKLSKILESILDELNVPKPEDAYKFYKIEKKDLGYGTMYRYVYENVNGDLMEISNLVTKHPKEPGKSIYLAFKKYEGPGSNEEEYDNEEEEDRKYSEKTGAGDMIKVLATVVQSVRNTMKKEGGENKIYAIKFSPADNKRANIYLHYIKTLFPDFKEEKGVEAKFTTFVNKNFKKKVMAEVGDASKTPYPIKTVTDDYGERQYIFSTDSGFQYQVKVETIEDGPMKPVIARVGFGVVDETDDISYVKQTGENDVYKIMATITSIVKHDLKSNHADIIEFSPSKREGNYADQDPMSNARTQLYSRYIKAQFPNAEVYDAFGDIRVKLK